MLYFRHSMENYQVHSILASYFFMFTAQKEQNSFSSQLILLPTNPHKPSLQPSFIPVFFIDSRGQRQVDPHFSVGLKFFNAYSLQESSNLYQRTKWLMKTLPSGKAREIVFHLIKQIFSRHQLWATHFVLDSERGTKLRLYFHNVCVN